MLHPEDRAAVAGLLLSLLTHQQELRHQNHHLLVEQQQVRRLNRAAAAAAAGAEEEGGEPAEVAVQDTSGGGGGAEDGNGALSNYADKSVRRGQIRCRVHALGRFSLFELSVRCGTSGAICFLRRAAAGVGADEQGVVPTRGEESAWAGYSTWDSGTGAAGNHNRRMYSKLGKKYLCTQEGHV